MEYRKLKLILGLMSFALVSFGQTPEEFEANYKARIQLEMINGVYIPFDLQDAFDELTRLSAPPGLAEFKSSPEDSIRRKLHFGLGRWIMINWGLEEGSRISDYMKKHGVALPDDMVEVIIITWHRHLNGRPLKYNEEVAIIDKRIKEEKAKRDAQAQKTVIEKKPHKE